MLYLEGAPRNATAAKSVFQAAQKWEMQAPGNEFGYNPYSTLGIARKGGKFNCPKLLTFLFSFWSFSSNACPGIRELGGGPGSTWNPFPRRPRCQPGSIRHTCPYLDPQGTGAGGVGARGARAGVLRHALRPHTRNTRVPSHRSGSVRCGGERINSFAVCISIDNQSEFVTAFAPQLPPSVAKTLHTTGPQPFVVVRYRDRKKPFCLPSLPLFLPLSMSRGQASA